MDIPEATGLTGVGLAGMLMWRLVKFFHDVTGWLSEEREHRRMLESQLSTLISVMRQMGGIPEPVTRQPTPIREVSGGHPIVPQNARDL